MNRDLWFSGDGINGFRLRAQDDLTALSLERLAKLCNLSLSESCGDADAVLTSTGVPENAVKMALPQKYRRIGYFRCGDCFYVLTPTGRTPGYFAFEAQKILLLGHAAAIAARPAPEVFNLMHGALLEEAGGKCTLLFGDSGVGKSTSVRRYCAAGGRAVADDMFMLYCKESRWFARPMPTWSAVVSGKNPDVYDFRQEFEVSRLLLLLRDSQKEHISAVSPVQYNLSLLKSAAETNSWLLPYVSEKARKSLTGHLTGFASAVSRCFPPQALFANLDGNILETLSEKKFDK